MYLSQRGRETYGMVYRQSRQNCAQLKEYGPEWNITNNCYQRAEENYQNGLKVYSFKKFWAYSFVYWRVFLPIILVPPIALYIVAALVGWIIRGLKTDAAIS
jgi:hypothetical protein